MVSEFYLLSPLLSSSLSHFYLTLYLGSLIKNLPLFISVAEPKLFIFGPCSNFDHNFGSGSGSSYSHILALKTVLKY